MPTFSSTGTASDGRYNTAAAQGIASSARFSGSRTRLKFSTSRKDRTSEVQPLSATSVPSGPLSQIIDTHENLRVNSASGAPSRSQSQKQLDVLLPNADTDLKTYGVNELRDGFFDATYYRPQPRNRPEMMRKASETLPVAMQNHDPLSIRYFLPRQCHIMVLSALLNHAGRPIGSQIDGTMSTILGTVVGLGWGSLALWVSTSTKTAQIGYGGVLSTFLVVFTATVAWVRCSFMRLYQAVISAGISICYTCLADTSEAVGWKKIFDYGIPWVFGQAIALIVSCTVVPDSGSHSLILSFHQALDTIGQGLVFPRQDNLTLRRDLTWHFVRLSTAVRDFTIEISISRFISEDARSLRNLVQGVIRALLAIHPDTDLFNICIQDGEEDDRSPDKTREHDLNVKENEQPPSLQAILGLIARRLANPTRSLIKALVACISSCDATLIDLGGQRRSLTPYHAPKDLSLSLQALCTAIESFEAADLALMNDPEFPSDTSAYPEVVALFLFVHPLRQAADKVRALCELFLQIQQRRRRWALRLPSYPLHKQFNRTNAQVRHDRGGLTAGFYFRTKAQLERTMGDLQSRPFVPTDMRDAVSTFRGTSAHPSITGYQKQAKGVKSQRDILKSEKETFRYKLSKTLHRMQGFECRFALKVVLATTLLSIPAWLEQSRDWWNDYELWWTVVTVWLMTHPRVSGTLQDLAARLFCAALGAVWGGLAYAADGGNPYVMAVFAAFFMIPMIHRYTQSVHPRSGLVGCITFTVISLSALADEGRPSTVKIVWTRGLGFAVAIFASILTNWVMWPFVARHELKKSISAMMLHLAILYRSVVSKYILYAEQKAPSAQDIERSEMLEGRLREGFVRIRQLLELTRHEIRLRAPFEPIPYSALIEACERFFEHLIEVRQSSLYFRTSPHVNSQESNNILMPYRRDAVAVILMNLYILASALRTNQPVPRYMPSAAAARKKLIDRMEEVEVKQMKESGPNEHAGRRWADVYRFAFASALTDIVEQLQQLQRYTKEITGEASFAQVAKE
ncbi:MAG: hypothetical protein Q9200_007042 [Gallowayella weberi]